MARIPNDGAATSSREVPKRRRERSPSVSSASDSSDESFEYPELSNSDSRCRDYVKYVGRIFDDDDDGGAFQILSINEMRRIGATRRSTNIVFAFKYVALDGPPDEYLYTPVREMLNSYWCNWRKPERSRADRSLTVSTAADSCTVDGSGSSSSRRSLRNSSNR